MLCHCQTAPLPTATVGISAGRQASDGYSPPGTHSRPRAQWTKNKGEAYGRTTITDSDSEPAVTPPSPPNTKAKARTIESSGRGRVEQTPTGRIIVSGFKTRGAGIALMNKAYQEAIKSGKPPVLIYGTPSCLGCKKMAAAAEAKGQTVLYVEDGDETPVLSDVFSYPQKFVLPADPNFRFQSGKTKVDSTVAGMRERVLFRGRGMKYYSGKGKTVDQRISDIQGIMDKMPVHKSLQGRVKATPSPAPSIGEARETNVLSTPKKMRRRHRQRM